VQQSDTSVDQKRSTRIVNGFDQLLLLANPKQMEAGAMDCERHLFEGLGGKLVSLLVAGHIGVAIAADAIGGKPLVNARQNGNSMSLGSILLRQNAGGHGEHRARFLLCEEAQRGRLFHALQNNRTRRRIPVSLLLQGTEPGIVTRLVAGRHGLAGGRIANRQCHAGLDGFRLLRIGH
jgi:hypothetical protein